MSQHSRNHLHSLDAMGRRTFIRRAAAIGLGAAASSSILAACATGGGDSASSPTSAGPALTTDAANPFGAQASAPLDVVIFNGGFGDAYAKFTEGLYTRKFADSAVKHTATQDISSLQPRFVAGNPPDVIDNSGAKALDNTTLAANGQLSDLTDLFAAPSYDDATVTVKNSLIDGVVDAGTIGDKVYQLNFVQSAWAMWYDAKLFAQKGWKYPSSWDDMLSLCETIKSGGAMAPWVYTGVFPQYLQQGVFHPMASKLGGQDVWKPVDNLEDGAWEQDGIKQALDALYQLKTGGFLLPGLASMTHTESQTAWLQHKAAFIPCGSWLENEMKSTIPSGFELTAVPVPAVGSGKLGGALTSVTPGEPLIVPAKAKNVDGGKEFLRTMVSTEAARKFAELTKTLTVVKGAHDDQKLGTAFESVNTLIKKSNAVATWENIKYTGWYKAYGDDVKAALNTMMVGDLDVAGFIARVQKKADQTRKDNKIKKFTR